MGNVAFLMEVNLNGGLKSLSSSVLILNFDKGNWFQGFRENKDFIDRHYSTLQMLSDFDWCKAKYMNKVYNLSSPKSSILGRYFCNILSAIFIDYYYGNLKEIVLKIGDEVEMDYYSQKIITIINKYTDIKIIRKHVPKKTIEKLTHNNMKVAIKRGLYDDYDINSEYDRFIFNYFKHVFFDKDYPMENLIAYLNKVDKKHEKLVLTRAIVNKAIREKNKNLAEKYVANLEKYVDKTYDFLNSASFYLLVFKSKSQCKKYLDDKIDIEAFLKSYRIDYLRSLTMKNYATILENKSKVKKSILKKCLQETPQDVDLWMQWMKLYSSDTEKQKIALDIFTNGYTDIRLLQYLKIKATDQDMLFRSCLLCMSNKNKDQFLELIPFFESTKLTQTLQAMLNNETDINKYVRGIVA